MAFLPGAMIGGKYRLERKIAEGGVGEVWIAVDQKKSRVAIKRLLPETAKDRELVARFRREAVLLGKLQSEHVSQVIEQITDPKFGLLLVMEFVDGESLADMLDKRRKLPVNEVVAIGMDIARAIGVLHEANIIHRDLKPENVILRRLSGGGTKAVLIDFGFARLDPHGQGKRPNDDALTGITRADTMLGTVAYMAPEQVLNSRDVGRAADIYALGCILYRAMSGRHVFGDVDDIAYARAKLDGEAPPLVVDRINVSAAAAAKIIMRAVKRRPVERFDHIASMLKELDAVRDAAPVQDDADAPTQNAAISALLGDDAPEILKLNNEGATSQTDRVVVNVPGAQAEPALAPTAPPPAPPGSPAPPAAAPAAEDGSVTRRRQAGVKTLPIPPSNPIAPPPTPLAPAPPPSLRLAPPPVPPKLAPMAPGVDDELPAHLRNTGPHRAATATLPMTGVDEDLPPHLRNTAGNRVVVVPAPLPAPAPAPGVHDDMPAHLRNTSRARGMPAPQLPAPLSETSIKPAAGIPLGVMLAAIAIALIAGFAIGWVSHASLSGHLTP